MEFLGENFKSSHEMNKRNIFWIIAAILNLLTAVVHTIGGQLDLVNPLLKSNLTEQAKTEWLGAWHMITIFLFATTYYLIKCSFLKNQNPNIGVIKSIGIMYILISIPFIISSIIMQCFAPQWIVLLPIGIMSLLGLNNN